MTAYFRLQYKMLQRQLIDVGLHPLAGAALLLLLFLGVSYYLFAQTSIAAYVYVLLALSLVFPLGTVARNDFLKTCFPGLTYRIIRLLENTLIVWPFLLFLAFKACFAEALLLLSGSILTALVPAQRPLNFTLPTPFSRYPFEFIVGFRSTFYLIFFAWFLTGMAVWADNFNLGIFALLLVFLVCLSYYTTPESQFYVWVYALGPTRFLWQKIRTALVYSTLLCLPITVGLAIFFSGYIGIIAAFQVLGYVYLVMIILAKYSSFPLPMNLPQGFFIAFSFWFPPLLLGIVPFFYLQANKRLNEILA